MENIVGGFIVANTTTFAITITTIIFVFFLTVIFVIVSKMKKSIEPRLLNIAYMVLYNAIAFILPLLFVWWFSALLSVVSVFLARKYYEKQSLILYFKKINENEEHYKAYLSDPIAVISVCIISYICGIVCFLGTTII